VGDDQLVGVGLAREAGEVRAHLGRGADGGVGQHRVDVQAGAAVEQQLRLVVRHLPATTEQADGQPPPGRGERLLRGRRESAPPR
jgi:hypothetical protein